MIAVVDVGNSVVHGVLYHEAVPVDRIRHSAAAIRSWSWPDRKIIPSLDAVVLSSVNPRVTRSLRRRYGKAMLELGQDVVPPIRSRYRRPRQAGADRLANAVAAWERFHRACMVVDVGTAVTFDFVSARGEFLGGAIAPGPSLSARAMHEHCALLPEVSPAPARRVVARDTVGNLRSGIFWGLVGLVNQMEKHGQRELRVKPWVVGTGGAAGLLRGMKIFDAIVPDLTLEGIAISYYHSRRTPCPFCRKTR